MESQDQTADKVHNYSYPGDGLHVSVSIYQSLPGFADTQFSSASSAVVARFPYLPRFRNFDFLYATVDIAIWSAVEQGLAITAGCLATLRPLVKEIGYRMGWTKPTSGSGGPTSGYVQQPDSRHLGSGRSGNRDMYDLSEFTHGDEESSINSKPSKEGRRAMRTSIIGFRSSKREKRESMKIKTVCEKNDSRDEPEDQQSKNIVVSKDFLVVSEWK